MEPGNVIIIMETGKIVNIPEAVKRENRKRTNDMQNMDDFSICNRPYNRIVIKW
jgi:hypothetical protein